MAGLWAWAGREPAEVMLEEELEGCSCHRTIEGKTAEIGTNCHLSGDRSIGSRPLPEFSGEPEECKPRIRRGLYNMSIHEVRKGNEEAGVRWEYESSSGRRAKLSPTDHAHMLILLSYRVVAKHKKRRNYRTPKRRDHLF